MSNFYIVLMSELTMMTTISSSSSQHTEKPIYHISEIIKIFLFFFFLSPQSIPIYRFFPNIFFLSYLLFAPFYIHNIEHTIRCTSKDHIAAILDIKVYLHSYTFNAYLG